MMRLLRMLGILLGMLMAVGFGLCGAFGVFQAGRVGWTYWSDWSLFLVCGLAGLGIGWVFARAVWLALKGKPGAGAPPAQ